MSDQTPTGSEKKAPTAAGSTPEAAPKKEAASASAPAPAPADKPKPAPAKPAPKKAAGGPKKYIMDKVHVWPHLTRLEMLSAIAATILLTVWSILLDAPLEEPANPARTPNPSKAPWYFLGLQEMLVYFDPWIAGVVLPSMIIVGLMVIPYVDPNPKGNGYYTFRERWFAISTFLFGFLLMWITMILIGTFVRGPGWNLYWPWQEWDPHKVVPLNNVDLNQLLAAGAMKLGASPSGGVVQLLLNQKFAALMGLTFVAGFYLTGLRFLGHIVAFQSRVWSRFWEAKGRVLGLMGLALLGGLAITVVLRLMGFASVGGAEAMMKSTILTIAGFAVLFVLLFSFTEQGLGAKIRDGALNFKKTMGPARYYTVGLLYVTMLFLVTKILLRQTVNLKYFVQLPWFNSNI